MIIAQLRAPLLLNNIHQTSLNKLYKRENVTPSTPRYHLILLNTHMVTVLLQIVKPPTDVLMYQHEPINITKETLNILWPTFDLHSI